MGRQRLWTAEFIAMGVSSFFQYMAQYVLLATLPLFIMESLHGGDFEAGLAMTFFQVGTVCCRPFAGKWIDSYNKQKLLLGATGVFLALMLLFNFISSLPLILALRLVHGAVFAMGTTAAAALATMVLPDERKGEGIGYFAVFSNFAMVLGPFLGLLLLSFSPRLLFAFLAIIAGVTFWVSNRSQLPPEIVLPVKKRKQGHSLADFIEKQAVPTALLGGLVFFSYAGVITFIPLYLKTLGLETMTSMFFAAFALVIVLTRPLVGRAFDRIGAGAVIYPGFALFAAGLVLLGSSSSSGGMFAAAAVLGAGFGALSPAFQTIAIQSSPAVRAGVATATYFWSLDIFVGLGALGLSLISLQVGYQWMYMISAMVVLLAAIFYLVGFGRGGKNKATVCLQGKSLQ